jgi:hypothetical protein
MTAEWKLDPSLRGRREGVVAIAVQPIATATDDDLGALARFGLTPPRAAGGVWTGTVAADRLLALAALSSVGYIFDAAGSSSTGVIGRTPVARPGRPAKRGHTKLPPRRS